MGKRVRARKLIKVEEWQDESVECSGKCVDRLAGTQSICGFRSRRPGADTSHLCVAVPQRNSAPMQHSGFCLHSISVAYGCSTSVLLVTGRNIHKEILCPAQQRPKEDRDFLPGWCAQGSERYSRTGQTPQSRGRRRKWHVR